MSKRDRMTCHKTWYWPAKNYIDNSNTIECHFAKVGMSFLLPWKVDEKIKTNLVAYKNTVSGFYTEIWLPIISNRFKITNIRCIDLGALCTYLGLTAPATSTPRQCGWGNEQMKHRDVASNTRTIPFAQPTNI